MKKFDVVNVILTDNEIKELAALCAEKVTVILRDINKNDTMKAAKRWMRRCVDELCLMRAHGDENYGYTFSPRVKFYYNNARYDQRYRFQSEFYTTHSYIVTKRLLELEDRWSEHYLLVLGEALTEGLQDFYDSGRKIPKNQYWEQDFEVDRVLWWIMTSLNNILVQRDTPRSASPYKLSPSLMTSNIVSYMRMVLNASALCTLIEQIYGPDAQEEAWDGDDADRAAIRLMLNLSRLMPELIKDLTDVTNKLEGGSL